MHVTLRVRHRRRMPIWQRRLATFGVVQTWPHPSLIFQSHPSRGAVTFSRTPPPPHCQDELAEPSFCTACANPWSVIAHLAEHNRRFLVLVLDRTAKQKKNKIPVSSIFIVGVWLSARNNASPAPGLYKSRAALRGPAAADANTFENFSRRRPNSERRCAAHPRAKHHTQIGAVSD